MPKSLNLEKEPEEEANSSFIIQTDSQYAPTESEISGSFSKQSKFQELTKTIPEDQKWKDKKSSKKNNIPSS